MHMHFQNLSKISNSARLIFWTLYPLLRARAGVRFICFDRRTSLITLRVDRSLAIACGLCDEASEGLVEVLVKVLHVFAYTSDRKRMSVLVRVLPPPHSGETDGGEHLLFCKVERARIDCRLCMGYAGESSIAELCVGAAVLMSQNKLSEVA